MSEDPQANKYDSIDPFPDIPPALLNSADITRYADVGCLVTEFDPGGLKSAAYTMKFLGTLHWWENEDEGLLERREHISAGETYTLPNNSISYLFTKEKFRLPDYIAARINFRIPFVHKGMLLGTGPLVDAGFHGSLLIPLHNLTNNDYHIVGGEPIIWVEFTKLSPHTDWTVDEPEISSELVKFDGEKLNLSAAAYLKKAEVTAKGGVQSAFRGALSQVRASAEAARENAESAAAEASTITKRFTLGGIIVSVIGLATLLVAGATVLIAARQMSQFNNDMAMHIQNRLSDHAQSGMPHSQLPTVGDIEDLRGEIDRLTERVQQLERVASETSPPKP